MASKLPNEMIISIFEMVQDLGTMKNIRLSSQLGYASVNPAPIFRPLKLSKSRRNAFKKVQIMEQWGVSKYVEKVIICTSCYALEAKYVDLDREKPTDITKGKSLDINWDFWKQNEENEDEPDVLFIITNTPNYLSDRNRFVKFIMSILQRINVAKEESNLPDQAIKTIEIRSDQEDTDLYNILLFYNTFGPGSFSRLQDRYPTPDLVSLYEKSCF